MYTDVYTEENSSNLSHAQYHSKHRPPYPLQPLSADARTESEKDNLREGGGCFLFEAGDIRICFCTYAIQVLQTLSAFVYNIYVLYILYTFWGEKGVIETFAQKGQKGSAVRAGIRMRQQQWYMTLFYPSIIVLLIPGFFIFIQHFCKWMIRLACIDTSILN